MSILLEVRDVTAGYGAGPVLHGIDLHVEDGEVVVVLGANGAGKTTLMRAITGLIPSIGTIRLDGEEINGIGADLLVARGMSLVPQGRGTLTALSVHDNLLIGAVTRRDRKQVESDIDRWYGIFPRLAERRRQLAGTLSGGEQQMLALARGLMSRPRILLCDEASLGLAPRTTREIFARLREANVVDGVALLLVEQNAALAMSVAHRVYLIRTGRIAGTGPVADFRDDILIRSAYLGL